MSFLLPAPKRQGVIKNDFRALKGSFSNLENGIMGLGVRVTLGMYTPVFYVYTHKRNFGGTPYFFNVPQLEDLVNNMPKMLEEIATYDPEGDHLYIPYSGIRHVQVAAWGAWEKTINASFIEIVPGKFNFT